MKKTTKLTIHNEWFGNKVIVTNSWPEKTREQTIRIYGQNVNGISYFNDYSEWEIILENLHNLQVDVACLTEINLDVMMPEVKYTMLEKAKKWIRM